MERLTERWNLLNSMYRKIPLEITRQFRPSVGGDNCDIKFPYKKFNFWV